MRSAIYTARDIDQKSKQAGFNQEAFDQMARQGFANAKFETDIKEGLDVVGEFYQGEEQLTDPTQLDLKVWKNNKSDQKENIFFEIQQSLQESVEVVS